MRGSETALPWLDLFREQRKFAELDEQRQRLMEAALLTGDECTLFGRRVRLRLEWVDECPFTEAQLKAMGETWKASAIARTKEITGG